MRLVGMLHLEDHASCCLRQMVGAACSPVERKRTFEHQVQHHHINTYSVLRNTRLTSRRPSLSAAAPCAAGSGVCARKHFVGTGVGHPPRRCVMVLVSDRIRSVGDQKVTAVRSRASWGASAISQTKEPCLARCCGLSWPSTTCGTGP